VLSEFAGAAAELRQAYRVNPYDINGLKEALLEAIRAPEKERTRRMKAMRKQVVENDIELWATRFLDDLRTVRHTHDKTPRPARDNPETTTRRR
jgi:trehalose 6-phosphate synthase